MDARRLSALIDAAPREHGGPPVRWRACDNAGALLPLETVLAAGARVTLEGPANRAAGGGATERTRRRARTAGAIALRGGCRDGAGVGGRGYVRLSPARDLSALQVIEVNSNPMIETLGRSRPLGSDRGDLARQFRRGAADEDLARAVSEVRRGTRPGACGARRGGAGGRSGALRRDAARSLSAPTARARRRR